MRDPASSGPRPPDLGGGARESALPPPHEYKHDPALHRCTALKRLLLLPLAIPALEVTFQLLPPDRHGGCKLLSPRDSPEARPPNWVSPRPEPPRLVAPALAVVEAANECTESAKKIKGRAASLFAQTSKISCLCKCIACTP